MHVDSLGDSDGAGALRAERLLHGHGEAAAPPSVGALGQRRDGHQRDGVRDPGAGRVRLGDRRHDGLVVAVAAGGGGGRGGAEEMEDPREVFPAGTLRM